MSRASGIPIGRARTGMTNIIDRHTEATTVERVTTTRDELDDLTETVTEHTEDLWLYEPNETTAMEISGKEIKGSLGGLLVAKGGEDLQVDDRITHGGVEYEATSVVGHPNDEPADGSASYDTIDFWVIDFDRRQ